MTERAAVILAGGASKRMGQDKAALDFGGKSLLLRVAETLRPLVEPLMLVLAPGQRFDPGLALLGPQMITDPKPHLGPLYALSQAVNLLGGEGPVLVIGCDLPFLSAGFIKELFAAQEGFDVAAAQNQGVTNPLLAVYSRSVLSQAKGLYKSGRQDAKALLEGQAPKLLKDRPEAQGINDPQAYQAALKQLGLA